MGCECMGGSGGGGIEGSWDRLWDGKVYIGLVFKVAQLDWDTGVSGQTVILDGGLRR